MDCQSQIHFQTTSVVHTASRPEVHTCRPVNLPLHHKTTSNLGFNALHLTASDTNRIRKRNWRTKNIVTGSRNKGSVLYEEN